MALTAKQTSLGAPQGYTEPVIGQNTAKESSISNWIGPYVTEMLGKGAALSNKPYEAYGGPLTAGPSALQNQAFQGVANLTVPTDMGGFTPRSFASPMGGQPNYTFMDQKLQASQAAATAARNPNIESGFYSSAEYQALPKFGQRNAIQTKYFGQLNGFQGGMDAAYEAYLNRTGQPAPTSISQGWKDEQASLAANKEKYGPGYSGLGMDIGGVMTNVDKEGNALRPLAPPMAPSMAPSMAPPGQPMGQPSGIAASYMNPYVQQALNPQLKELQRQQEIKRVANAGRLTKAGAYGGSRQAIMDSELDRAGLDTAAGITGKGYSDAFTNAQAQFNKEQDLNLRAQQQRNQYGLDALGRQASLGATQQGITAAGIAADKKQFEEEREFPYKNVTYAQSLLGKLPMTASNYGYADSSDLMKILAGASALTGNTGTGGGGIGSLLSGIVGGSGSSGSSGVAGGLLNLLFGGGNDGSGNYIYRDGVDGDAFEDFYNSSEYLFDD